MGTVNETYALLGAALCMLPLAGGCQREGNAGAQSARCPCSAPAVCVSGECVLPCQDTLAHDGCPAGQFCNIDEGERGPFCRPIAGRINDPGSSGRIFVCVDDPGGMVWTVSQREAAGPGKQRWRVWKSCVSDPESSTHLAKCSPELAAAPVVEREPCGDEAQR